MLETFRCHIHRLTSVEAVFMAKHFVIWYKKWCQIWCFWIYREIVFQRICDLFLAVCHFKKIIVCKRSKRFLFQNFVKKKRTLCRMKFSTSGFFHFNNVLMLFTLATKSMFRSPNDRFLSFLIWNFSTIFLLRKTTSVVLKHVSCGFYPAFIQKLLSMSLASINLLFLALCWRSHFYISAIHLIHPINILTVY